MKLHFAFSLLALSASAMANIKIQEELYVPGKNPEIVKELVDTGSVIIDHVTSEGFELYGSKGLSRYLDQKNIVHLDMKEINDKALADYPTSVQVGQKLQDLARRFPNIMRLFSIGKSVRGKDLWVMKISDNPAADEVEPEFKYISSMHGDEITGRELTVALIEEIGQKYGRDPELTELVNNTELFIMPSMNPDGSDMRQRANANYVDLNRNFPDMTRDTQSSPNGRQIENQAVMAFQASRQFSLSANFHGGTIVANYPWDSKYDLHPLNDFVKELSVEYAELNPEMRSSDEFPQGVTNGAAWYIVRGGMQDWSYVWHNDLQITVELSHQKWPSYSEIPEFYRNNRDSMVHFMKQIHRGAGFKISRPNVQGVVNIRNGNRDMGNFSFKGSEFYKVMPEGDYTFTVQEKNATPKVLNLRVQRDMIRPNGNYVQLN
ncbi:M14 family zinc carboxypeptidase [Peredibacter sp. HCB2-198]|uniref:M14 family zinc carboxypeptidase n=1 Tax=Peredibacter sp. HCB2-198 TaxID=3383025 RepID=UPI0038B67C84